MTDPMTTTRQRWRAAPSIDDVRRGADLRSDHRGRSVRDVQQKLVDLGYLPREHQGRSNVDGLFGARTRTALEDFQRNNGLDATGRMSPETYDRLFLPGPVVSRMNQVSGYQDSPAEQARLEGRRQAEVVRNLHERVERTAQQPAREVESRPWTNGDLGRTARTERAQFGRDRVAQMQAQLMMRSPAMTPEQVTAANDAIRRLRDAYTELGRSRWTTPDASVAADMNRLERAVIRATGSGT
jgi:peptidoglycan hydrolase-like protein with peptidoglycan-binding domain